MIHRTYLYSCLLAGSLIFAGAVTAPVHAQEIPADTYQEQYQQQLQGQLQQKALLELLQEKQDQQLASQFNLEGDGLLLPPTHGEEEPQQRYRYRGQDRIFGKDIMPKRLFKNVPPVPTP